MTLYYSAHIPAQPTGGIKQIIRHVEVLRAAGWDARVLALGASAKLDWLQTEVPIEHSCHSLKESFGDMLGRVHPRLGRWGADPRRDLGGHPGVKVQGEQGVRTLGQGDYLVVPEHFGMGLGPIQGCRVAVFNQNVHYTFRGLVPGASAAGSFCGDPAIPVIVVSRHNQEYLQYAFPGRTVYLTSNGVDSSRFRYRKEKKRQIAFMPRKLPDDLADVLFMLRQRGVLDGWSLLPIEGMTEVQVAQHLGESLVYLTTSHIEGFGLPALEALLSGCQVVGYTGIASAEFFDETTGFPVPDLDRLALARRLEWLLGELGRAPEPWLARAEQVSSSLGERYSLAREAKAIVELWSELAPDHRPRVP